MNSTALLRTSISGHVNKRSATLFFVAIEVKLPTLLRVVNSIDGRLGSGKFVIETRRIERLCQHFTWHVVLFLIRYLCFQFAYSSSRGVSRLIFVVMVSVLSK